MSEPDFPPINLTGSGGKLVYDKASRTIVRSQVARRCDRPGCAETVGPEKDRRWEQGQCPECGLWFHKSAAAHAETERNACQLAEQCNEIEARRRRLEDVSCRQQNEIGRLNTRITNLTYALERVKHGAEYCDELGGLIESTLDGDRE